ncbi:MAG: crossover junction endodeoxyribonuclease RuvC [Acidobacteriota bacterium]
MVLGLDPGSQVTGWALVFHAGTRIVGCRLGTWPLGRSGSRAERLARLAGAAERDIADAQPDVAAIEGTFQHRNARAALSLAEARGVLLAVLGRLGIATAEYPPATVKQTICGNGTAGKDQVRRALLRTTAALSDDQLSGVPDDAVDALAIAVCHLFHARFSQRARSGRR